VCVCVFYTKWTREMKDGKDGREEKKEENGGKKSYYTGLSGVN